MNQFPHISGVHFILFHRLTNFQAPQVVMNLIFTYNRSTLAPPVLILWSTYLRGVRRDISFSKLPLKTEAKYVVITSAFSSILTHWLAFFDLFLADTPVEIFLVILWFPVQFQLQICCSLHDPILI